MTMWHWRPTRRTPKPLPSVQTRAKLALAIAQLPEEFRMVLILRELEDMSYREIAQVTSLPIGTVMSRLARARALLKDKWFNQVERSARHGMS